MDGASKPIAGDDADVELSVAYGELVLCELHLGSVKSVREAVITVDGEPVPATLSAQNAGWTVLFGEDLVLKPGQRLGVVTRG